MTEPTATQCRDREKVMHDGIEYTAFWHFQWGGYCGRALLSVMKSSDCFDVYVWHDGDFPYSDELPKKYHYCGIDQVRDFCKFVERKQKEKRND